MSKTVLVTGASSGIGEATAYEFHAAGWNVYAGARGLDSMRELEREGIHIVDLDVTDDALMKQCIEHIIKESGRLDVLINNAGYGSYGALEDVTVEEAKYQFEVNIFGLARMTQLALPHMRDQGSGRIVNISSIGGSFGEPHGSWYHATKYAVEGLSDSLRMELKQFGIDVIIIKPGAIRSAWSGIAQKKLLEVSGDTAYGPLARKHAAMLDRFDGQGSDPKVVATAIVKACTVAKPKTRYAVGRASGLMMCLRRILSDRMFDRMMLSQMK